MSIILIFSLIIVCLLCYTFSKPECVNCKSYIPNKFNKNYGYCKLFTNKVYFNNNEKIIYNYANHCRNNEYLCGINGFLFENAELESKNNYVDVMSKKTSEELELKIRLIDIIIRFKNSFLDNSINEEKDEYLDDFTVEEKKAYDLYCKKYLKNNLPNKYDD